MTRVRQTEEFGQWFRALVPGDRSAVNRVLSLLETRGVALGEPHSSALRGSRFARVLLGGSKAGEARFYRRGIARAEALWEEHLRSLELGGAT